MVKEIWKSIPAWEGYYSVSNKGNVRSERRIIQDSRNKGKYVIEEKILKLSLDNSGKKYWRVSLSRKSKIIYCTVHRLVAWAFIGEQIKGMEVRHLDGNCRNNDLSNLCYGTKSENIADAKRHGTFPIHERRPGAKLTKQQAIEIVMSKNKLSTLAKIYKVKSGTIRQIKIGETWTEVTKEYRKNNPYIYTKRYRPSSS